MSLVSVCRSKIAVDRRRDAPKSLASAKRCRVGLHTWDFGAPVTTVAMFHEYIEYIHKIVQINHINHISHI